MKARKFSMWLRATCGALIIAGAAHQHGTFIFIMGMGIMLSACLLAISIVVDEPA